MRVKVSESKSESKNESESESNIERTNLPVLAIIQPGNYQTGKGVLCCSFYLEPPDLNKVGAHCSLAHCSLLTAVLNGNVLLDLMMIKA